MGLKIATWNLCLGLFHKKDYVRKLLNENEIDILNLQETELETGLDLKNLHIRGYVLESETNEKKIRVVTYIRNTITYTRRADLESPNLHLIILDIKNEDNLRVITLYRTFNPQDKTTARAFFRK
jgi:exonuclease III